MTTRKSLSLWIKSWSRMRVRHWHERRNHRYPPLAFMQKEFDCTGQFPLSRLAACWKSSRWTKTAFLPARRICTAYYLKEISRRIYSSDLSTRLYLNAPDGYGSCGDPTSMASAVKATIYGGGTGYEKDDSGNAPGGALIGLICR